MTSLRMSAAKAYIHAYVCRRGVEDIYVSSSLLFSPWSPPFRCTPRDCKDKVSVPYNPEVPLFLASKIYLPSQSQHSPYELREFRSPAN
jgi:hypothetical protein